MLMLPNILSLHHSPEMEPESEISVRIDRFTHPPAHAVFFLVLDNGVVKHYKLRKTEDGRHYVSSSRVFATLTELVDHYCNQADGLCVRLREPCRRVILISILIWTMALMCLFFKFQLSFCAVIIIVPKGTLK